jgi:hypothetical protein
MLVLHVRVKFVLMDVMGQTKFMNVHPVRFYVLHSVHEYAQSIVINFNIILVFHNLCI